MSCGVFLFAQRFSVFLHGWIYTARLNIAAPASYSHTRSNIQVPVNIFGDVPVRPGLRAALSATMPWRRNDGGRRRKAAVPF
jgi:hypothetical protein